MASVVGSAAPQPNYAAEGDHLTLLGHAHQLLAAPAALAFKPLTLGLLLLLLTISWLHKKKNKKQQQLLRPFPAGPLGWPILGHLPLLTSAPHRVLADLCRKQAYGPILGLRLGSVPTVVVSNVPFAKEVLQTHDKIFANRPYYQFVEDLYYGYNNGVVFSSYNPRWAWMRKLYTLELFTAKRLQQLQYIRQEEVCRLLERLRDDSCGGTQPVNVGKLLADFTSSTTARLLQSEALSPAQAAIMDLPELVHFLEAEAFPSLGDFIPWLRFLDVFSIRHRQRIHRRIDQLMDSILCRRRHLMAHCPPEDLPNDFLQVLMSREGAMEDEEHLTTHEIKALILDLFAGGVHTSAATLEWAIAELVKNPKCMEKLRKEVDEVMHESSRSGGGEERLLVKDEDVQRGMPYLMDVVKEVMRLHPILPLVFPRVASQECKLGDKYVLPKGTNVILNTWAIARDPSYWDKPEEFRPERFQEGDAKEVDVRGQHYELLPFGSGRRVCPGMRLGLSIVHVTLANLVRSFEWHLPPGLSPASLDMSEKGGIGNSRAVPILAIPTPTTPPSLLSSHDY